jgi:hypothetical protein
VVLAVLQLLSRVVLAVQAFAVVVVVALAAVTMRLRQSSLAVLVGVLEFT